MPQVVLRGFTRGLWAAGPSELTPAQALRRARGVHDVKTGDIRSRWGSPLVASFAGSIHSLARFSSATFAGVGSQVLREGVAITLPSGVALDGTRLSFAPIPPSTGQSDLLYIAGSSGAFASSGAGSATKWGIAVPASALTAADGGAGGNLSAGAYLYKVTYINGTKGTESNGSAASASVTLAASRKMSLSAIPTSADPQVTGRKLYRTLAGGTAYFLVDTIADNTTTVYTDNIADAALGVAIPTLNTVPSPQPSFVFGPFLNRLFWLAATAGNKGTLYFSEAGLPESMRDQLVLTNDSDPLQAGLVWNAALWVFSKRSLFQILGTYPFVSRQYREVPGLAAPYAFAPTPLGILYSAESGLRLFDGQVSQLVGAAALGPLFQGEALENLTAFTPLVAIYHQNEFFVSDGAQTLVLNATDLTWRDLGLGITSFAHDAADAAHPVYAGLGTDLVKLEDHTTFVGDAGAGILFEIEYPGQIIGDEYPGLLRYLIFDANTQGQSLTPSVVIDGVVYGLPAFQTPSRQLVEFPIGRSGRVAGARLKGTLTAQVEVFAAILDVYVPVPEPTLKPAKVVVG